MGNPLEGVGDCWFDISSLGVDLCKNFMVVSVSWGVVVGVLLTVIILFGVYIRAADFSSCHLEMDRSQSFQNSRIKEPYLKPE